ncbi:MAG: MBL fold metallo-hydrolase [Candidatus Kapaibacterium sp.]|nr:MBL fold metallo-hydrolase [Bacteroidota bacterium]
MKLEFCGAAQTVTGSMHLLHINGLRVLLDCGLFQGRREEAKRINKEFPFDAASIDAVILSHAHIDHAGNLPHLVKAGFTGTIWCTPATRDLCSIMLADSAMIQEKDAEYLLKHKGEIVEPLYTMDDVSQTLEQMHSIGYHRTFDVVRGVTAQFFDAGHILGSAVTMLTLQENGRTVKLCFTGDVGRPNRPILRDPEFPGHADYIISESTYGGRLHDEPEKLEDKLLQVIQNVIDKKGKLIIPAFSVGRTQDIVYHLNNMYNAGKIPQIPIFVDSPLSFNATNIYRLHPECYDDEIRKVLMNDSDPFGFATLKYTRTVDESKKINRLKKAHVVIASSGMCESGRVVHHLMHSVGSPRNTVLIVGFNAEYTLGRKLADGHKTVNIMGIPHKVRCEIEKISGLSAHADESELMNFFKPFSRTTLQHTFLVHGEPEAQEALISTMKSQGVNNVTNPTKGTIVDL